MDELWVSNDACTLPTAERPLRVAEFDDLFAHHLVDLERLDPVPTRLRLTLAGRSDLESGVRDLIDRESACCSFFEFTLTPLAQVDGREESWRLEIVVPASRADVLAALADRAEEQLDSRR